MRLRLVRNDGVMVTMAIDRAQNVVAWSRQITSGAFESVATIPSATDDVVYAIVRRTVNGQTVRYVEMLSSALYTDAAVTGSAMLEQRHGAACRTSKARPLISLQTAL